MYSTCAELYFINVLYTVPTTPLDNFDILEAVKPVSVPGRFFFSEKSIYTCKNQVPGLSHASYGVESKYVVFCLFSTPSVLEKTVTEICMVAENYQSKNPHIEGI